MIDLLDNLLNLLKLSLAMMENWRGKERTMNSGRMGYNQSGERDGEKGLRQKLLEMESAIKIISILQPQRV
jgi:hypothetical protein